MTKRIVDIAFCVFLIFLTAPVMGLIFLLIRMDSYGSSVFKQKRVGFDREEPGRKAFHHVQIPVHGPGGRGNAPRHG